jgi:hypothetical protein
MLCARKIMLGAPGELKARPSGMMVAPLGMFVRSGCFMFTSGGRSNAYLSRSFSEVFGGPDRRRTLRLDSLLASHDRMPRGFFGMPPPMCRIPRRFCRMPPPNRRMTASFYRMTQPLFSFLPPFCRRKEGFFTVLIASCLEPQPPRTVRDHASPPTAKITHGDTREGAQTPVPTRSCALATWRSRLSLSTRDGSYMQRNHPPVEQRYKGR